MRHPNVIHPDWPAPASVGCLITTRDGGVSVEPYTSLNPADHVGDDPAAVVQNRAMLRALLPQDPHWLKQVHGTGVFQVTATVPASVAEADAAVTRLPGAVCVVLTADCLPVLFCDRAGTVVGVAHAGWRGLCAGVLEQTVQALGVPAASILAYLGPAIGPQAFEVGPEVRDAFMAVDLAADGAFIPHADGKFLADIYRLACQRLARAGVHHVYGGGECTYTDSKRFYSYRREGATGRMASLIWINSSKPGR